MEPLVSIVTICWNRKQEILESLKGIHQVRFDALEVIVVDNGSTDGTAEAIKEAYPTVRLIRLPENIGIKAYNKGFQIACGEYIIILDDDSFPHAEAVQRMVEKFQQDAQLGVVAFDVRNYYQYDDVKEAESQVPEKNTAATSSHYLMAFNGAGAGVRRNVLEEAGYYPEEFFLYWNEQDTAFRILNRGYKIEFFSDVVAYHKYSPKNRLSWRAPYYYTRNAFWLIWKNYPISAAIGKTMQLVNACFYHAMEQKTWIYIRAMRDAFLQIGKLKGKRQPVQPTIWQRLRIPFYVAFTFYK